MLPVIISYLFCLIFYDLPPLNEHLKVQRNIGELHLLKFLIESFIVPMNF
jgi:hypothetical protein